MQVIINKYKNKNIIVIEYNLSWSRISALFHENPASRTFFSSLSRIPFLFPLGKKDQLLQKPKILINP